MTATLFIVAVAGRQKALYLYTFGRIIHYIYAFYVLASALETTFCPTLCGQQKALNI